MSFEWFVARRYLRSPHRPAILRLITLFSVIGVAAGVATLVIALSMNSGFSRNPAGPAAGRDGAHFPHAAGLRRNLQLSGVIGKTAADARSAFGYTSDL